ncbi:MAG: HAD-IB family phosphatase [Planctomycetes bacterium]|nr:HAD-IB family phosphatase [Planctomycetota bacterium]
MISVIIPTLNEEKTIGRVITLARQSKGVDEVIVVDDKSVDRTVEIAKESGTSVITSPKIGKGASMMDGLLVAKNNIVVYLDGDIDNYAPDVIDRLAEPILKDEADFVKSTFGREAGRVTELVAKPLLSLLMPEALKFSQPLSGIIAGKKVFLQKITFENDYGVDIGILLDMLNLGVRIREVNIGNVSHKMKQWRELGKMSREVSRAILKRSRTRPDFSLDSLETINIIRDQMELAIKETLLPLKKMIIFDMDNTLLEGRFIFTAAKEFNFEKELIKILATNSESYLLTKLIAQHLKGLNIAQMLAAAEKIPLVSDAIETIQELKKRGYIVGIISDSYDAVANHIKMKIGADFAIANELEFSNSIATGEVKVPSYFMRTEESKCNHNFCKSNVMLKLAQKYDMPLGNIIAVGDSEYDICMVRFAGIGIAFCSSNHILNSVADYRIEAKSFNELLNFAL